MIFATPLGEFQYTEAEASMLAKLAGVRVQADAGNRRAKAQIAKLARQVAALRRKAKRSATAARQLRVIEESGILEPSQVFAME